MIENLGHKLILFTLLIGVQARAHVPVAGVRETTEVSLVTRDFVCSHWKGSKLYVLDEMGDPQKLRFENFGVCARAQVALNAGLDQAAQRRGYLEVRVSLNAKGRITRILQVHVEHPAAAH